MSNHSLRAARNAKFNEWFTRMIDVEEEMSNYRQHFKGATIYCNADSPFESNFFKYFVRHFEEFGLKKLIATCYSGTPEQEAYKAVVTTVRDAAGNVLNTDDMQRLFQGANALERLQGNGDFRSPECIALLEQADIAITNTPFSLFRDYIGTMMEHDKKFIVLGSMNSITYKEIFPHLKANRIWLGAKSLNQDMYFDVPDERKKWLLENKKEGSAYKIIDGKVMGRLASACWFTNLDHKKRHDRLPLKHRYDPEAYPRYDNYDAINVSKVAEIPCDYDGVMGVPITFMDKYNPEQFELIGHEHDLNGDGSKASVAQFSANGHSYYKRILIRNRHPEKRAANAA